MGGRYAWTRAAAMATMRVLLSEIDLVSAGEVVYPPGGRLGPRWQRDVQLMLVHEGSARVWVDGGGPLSIPVGCVGLLLPGHREEFAFDHEVPTRHSWVQARGQWPGGDPAKWPGGNPPRMLPLSTALTELVQATIAATRAPLPTADALAGALAAAAFWRYAGEAEAREGGPGGAVERARAFLHAHLADPDVTLARTARAAHVTPAHLVRRFRAELGITPIAYLWQRRVATGIDLLTHTGLPVSDIAARVGFRSVYHFSRRVSAHAGRPPTALRRERWEPGSNPLR
jgi:AraC family transcriptional regulator of arabinose operon